ISQICRRACIPSAAASSIRPRNGDTIYAPISAARMAWAGENTSVTLIRISSSASRFPASRPAGVIGTLTTALSANEASRRPSSYIAAASGSVVSSETSPSTSARISFHTCSGSMASLKISDGFVVTPDSTPHRLSPGSPRCSRCPGTASSRLPSFELQHRLGERLAVAGQPLGGAVHHEVDDRRDRLVQVERGDHRPVVGQRLALDVLLHPSDVVEVADVAIERPSRGVRGPGLEVAPVHLLLIHRHHDRDGQDPIAEPLDVQEPRHHVGPLDDRAGPLDRRPLDQGPEAHGHRGGLLPEPHDDPVGRPRRRLSQRGVGVEGRGVQGRHELPGEQAPHDFSDRVGGDHPDHAQPGGDLGGDGRLPHPGGSSDQEHQGDVETCNALPPHEIPGVPLARLVLDHPDGQGLELFGGEGPDAPLDELVLDPLGHLVRAVRRQPADHDLGRHQALGVREAGVPVRDDDVRASLASGHRSFARSMASRAASRRRSGRSPSPSIVSARLSANTTSAPRSTAVPTARSTAAGFSSVTSTSYAGAASRSTASAARSLRWWVVPTTEAPWVSSRDATRRGPAAGGAVGAKNTFFPLTSSSGTGRRSTTIVRASGRSPRTWDIRTESWGPTSGPLPIVNTTRSDSKTRYGPM